MFENLQMLEQLKVMNENLLKLIELQEKATKIAQQWNADGLPENRQ